MKKRPSHSNKISIGAGFGMGLLGAVVLALRFGWKHQLRRPLSEAISPTIFATRMLHTPSGEIVYHTSGTGEPLLFLHGVFPGASSFEWSKVYPHFATHYQVLVPDLIGFGESQRPRVAVSAESQVQSLAEFLHNTTGGKAVTLVASGLSANLALLLAARYPHYANRLILWMPFLAIKGALTLHRFHRLSWFPQLAQIVYRRQLSTENDIKQWLLRSGFSVTDNSLEEVVGVLSSTAQQYGAEHAFLAQCSRSFWREFSSQLATLHLPISLLSSKNSERLTNESITMLRSYATRFSIHEIETESLLAPLTHPSSIISALTQELT
jgi:pimeloyl-ACP methyl ester carboxylesterase